MTVGQLARHGRLAFAADHVSADVFAGLADIAEEGLAVLDADRCFVYVNTAGARLLDVEIGRLLGQPALVFADAAGAQDGLRRTGVSTLPRADGARIIERTEDRFGDHTIVAFRDTTGRRRRDRHIAAFTETAAAITGSGQLQGLLDSVAAALLTASGAAACTVVLVDEDTGDLGSIGTAGGYPSDYRERLQGCVRRGAPLASVAALRTGEPFISFDWAAHVLRDPRWSPMHDVIRGRDWSALSAVPLQLESRAIGALTAFYKRGQEPVDEDVAFLTRLAAPIAIGIHNHRLVSELEARATVEERNRIARELHDSVSQALFSLRMQTKAVGLINDNAGDDRRERIRAGLDAIHDLTERALTEMRALIFQLRPGEFHGDGIAGALQRYAAAISARHGLEIDVVCDPDIPAMADGAGVHLFRISQEALHNIVRHANASHVHVVLRHDEARSLTTLAIEDDGRGFDAHAVRPGHLGLETMRERCVELGGTLTVQSEPGSTRVRVEIGGMA